MLIPKEVDKNIKAQKINNPQKKIPNKYNLDKNKNNLNQYDNNFLVNQNNFIINQNQKQNNFPGNRPLNKYKNVNFNQNNNQINNRLVRRPEYFERDIHSNIINHERLNYQNRRINNNNINNNRINRINNRRRVYNDYRNNNIDDNFPLSGLRNDNDKFARIFDMLDRIDGENAKQNKEIEKDLLDELPEIPIANSEKVNEDKKQCVICFGEFKNGDKVIILPCIHFYHSECIKMWFKTKKNICPDCKCEINEKNLYGEEGKQETPGK